MTESVRAFVAIELPDHVRDVLSEVVEHLRLARIQGLRPVRPEGVHLTLKFLGDIESGRVQEIVDVLTPMARGHSRFELLLGGPGAFPNTRSPRVLWLAIEGDLEPLAQLQDQAQEALQRLGYARDKRRFSPHLTVARLRDGTPPAMRRRAAETLASAPIDSGVSLPVEAMSLMRSRLHPQGARYERLALIPLAGLSAQADPTRTGLPCCVNSNCYRRVFVASDGSVTEACSDESP